MSLGPSRWKSFSDPLSDACFVACGMQVFHRPKGCGKTQIRSQLLLCLDRSTCHDFKKYVSRNLSSFKEDIRVLSLEYHCSTVGQQAGLVIRSASLSPFKSFTVALTILASRRLHHSGRISRSSSKSGRKQIEALIARKVSFYVYYLLLSFSFFKTCLFLSLSLFFFSLFPCVWCGAKHIYLTGEYIGVV